MGEKRTRKRACVDQNASINSLRFHLEFFLNLKNKTKKKFPVHKKDLISRYMKSIVPGLLSYRIYPETFDYTQSKFKIEK